jgi:hypothetical protein
MKLAIFAVVAIVAAAAPANFEVKSLPGWDAPLVSKTYCGFSSAGTPPSGEGSMYFNYIFLESENDPANDPVIVWYNGGPGAASMFGLFVELGPYYLNQDSLDDPKFNKTGIPVVQGNPYSWTKIANVIAVNNPPPIGFSYCDGQTGKNTGPEGDGYSCGPWNDTSVAKANHNFLKNLFKNDFPEFAKNDLFITGESYAGIYVPTIVREILADPGVLNLKGFAVGDGCMGTDVLCGSGNPDKGPFYRVEFMHGHGQVSERNYNTIMKECPEKALKSGNGMSAACTAAVKQMDDSLGGMFDYSLYDDCIYEEGFRRRLITGDEDEATLRRRLGGLNDYACPGIAMNIWLNRSDVRAALNIQPNNRFNSADNGIGMNYTLTEPNVLPIYENARGNTSLRVLVYNGDTDPGINSMVTQSKYFNYFDSIGVMEKEAWRPWTLDGKERMGGYVVTYPGDFHYLTIRGSGHMVPEYKPAATLAFMSAFVKGEEYKPYVKPTRRAKRSIYEL